MTTLLTRGTGAMTGALPAEPPRWARGLAQGRADADVTTHPAFSSVCRSLAAVYDLQCARHPRRDDLRAAGRPSRVVLLPAAAHGRRLLQRRRNAEVWAARHSAWSAAFPTSAPPWSSGLYDVREQLARREPEFAANVVDYHRFAQEHDLSLSHALHDPTMDKSLRPEQDPDRCIRVVAERDDGIVVRGCRPLTTFAPFSNEMPRLSHDRAGRARAGVRALVRRSPIATRG